MQYLLHDHQENHSPSAAYIRYQARITMIFSLGAQVAINKHIVTKTAFF
jgi:hypothetical protein